MVPDIWDGNFHSVSLHRLIEHLALNAINIRKSLHHMMKYIPNKKVERSKANYINDFKDIGEAAWDFILFFYELEWDELIADNNNHLFRHKVKA